MCTQDVTKYLVGKQLYNVANSTQDKQQQKELIKMAAYYFDKSVSEDQCGGLFYLG